MKKLKTFLSLSLFSLVLMPLLAFAQDGGVAGPTDGVTLLTFDPTDPGSVAKMLLDAVMAKQWGVVASLGVTALVAGVRKWTPENTKLGAWLRTKLGAIITTFLITLGTAFLTLFMAGGQFSLALVLKAVSVAVGASGSWSIWKNVSEAISEAKAQKAGNDAEAKPADTLNK